MNIKEYLNQNRGELYGLFSGINEYQKAPLEGCVNDAIQLRRAAVNVLGFKEENCTILLDSESTKEKFLSIAEEKLSAAKDDDTVLISNSGHGSQMPSLSYGEESDGVDEVLVMYGKKGQDLWRECIIRDDDIAGMLKRMKSKARVVFILDCCHTGTGTRTLGDPHVDYCHKYLMPPIEIRAEILEIERRRSQEILHLPADTTLNKDLTSVLNSVFNRLFGRPTNLYASQNIGQQNFKTVALQGSEVLYSGCLANEVSADTIVNGIPHGAMTGAFLQSLYHLKDNVFSYQKHYNNLMRALSNNSGGVFRQHPQLEIDPKLRERPFLT
jgi:hypothetical protein